MITKSITLEQIQRTKPFVDAIIINKDIIAPSGRYEGTADVKKFKFDGKVWEDSKNGKKYTDSQVKEEINALLKKKNHYAYFHAKMCGKKTVVHKQYHQLSEDTLDKVAKMAKKFIDADLSRYGRANWEGVDVEADTVYPHLMSAFEKVTGESDPDVLEKWCNKFLDEDIYRAQDMYDFVEETCDKYEIITDGTNDTYFGHKTTPKRKKAKKSCFPKLNVRNMF